MNDDIVLVGRSIFSVQHLIHEPLEQAGAPNKSVLNWCKLYRVDDFFLDSVDTGICRYPLVKSNVKELCLADPGVRRPGALDTHRTFKHNSPCHSQHRTK